MKQNQSLYRPFPGQKPETKPEDQLCPLTNCPCSLCRNSRDPLNPQIMIDQDLAYLRSYKQHHPLKSDYIYFIDQLNKQPSKNFLNFPILETIVFSSEGNVRLVLYYEHNRLKFQTKLSVSLSNFIKERKHNYDLQYQKKKYVIENPDFTFIQLDHDSQKLIKEFESNIKFMNSLLNRVAIVKMRQKIQEEVITQNQLNSIFGKVARKIIAFQQFQYIKIFPVMCGQEQNSYVRHIKYFRKRELNNPHYKLAQHYVSCWANRNETLERLQEKFMEGFKQDEEKLLMYYTYKIFLYFENVSQNCVESALVSYITNDQGQNFFLNNIECLKVTQMLQTGQKVNDLPKKLTNEDKNSFINLRVQMKKVFEGFQFQYNRLDKQRRQMQRKHLQDIEHSNQVYESVSHQRPKQNRKGQQIPFIYHLHSESQQTSVLELNSSNSTLYK